MAMVLRCLSSSISLAIERLVLGYLLQGVLMAQFGAPTSFLAGATVICLNVLFACLDCGIIRATTKKGREGGGLILVSVTVGGGKPIVYRYLFGYDLGLLWTIDPFTIDARYLNGTCGIHFSFGGNIKMVLVGGRYLPLTGRSRGSIVWGGCGRKDFIYGNDYRLVRTRSRTSIAHCWGNTFIYSRLYASYHARAGTRYAGAST